MPQFDPEGDGYDMETALANGLTADETGHWPSRVPKTGQILKGRSHETFSLTQQGEKDAGYRIQKGADGRYYSFPIEDTRDLETAHATKQVERSGASARTWAQERLAARAQAKATEAGSTPTIDAAAQPNPAYEAAKANFEAARPDIEAGKLRAYPTWADAQAQLEVIRQNPPEKDGEAWWQATIRNLSPLEAAGGALDYADNAFETIRQISAKGDEAMMRLGVPAITVGPDGVGTTTNYDEFAKTKNLGDALPDIGDPDKPGLARAVGKFMTGYAVAGRLLSGVQTLQTVAQSGRLGSSAVAALKGAMSDFTGLREMEGSLANLIQTSPTLANPVTEFLSAKEETPELVNKLKTALVGAGIGMAVDGVFAGIRAIRAGRQIEAGVGQVDALTTGLEREATTQKAMLSEALGPLDDPRLVIEAGDEAAAAGAAGAADDAARTAFDGATNPRPNAGGRIGDVYINWSRIDTPEDVKSVMDDLAGRYSDSIAEGQRGVRSHEATKLSAAQEDAWKILTERQKGQALNAEQTFAVRQLWSSSGTKVAELAKRVEAGGGTADRLALQKMIGIHSAITEQVLGIRTETARALNQWRILAGESDQFLSGMNSLMHDMESSGDMLSIAKDINRLADQGRVDSVDAFVQGVGMLPQLKKVGVNTSDAIRQLFYMSLLSGPKTTVRNSVSNLGMLAANFADRRGAAYLGEILGGQNVPDQEAYELLWGEVNGLLDSFRVSDYARQLAEQEGRTARSGFVNALMTGESGMGVGKLDVPPIGAFSAEKLGLDPTSNMGRVFDFIDTATKVPTNFLAAQDEVFRTSAYQGQIHALAYRKAWQEAESGLIERSGIGERAAELARDPSTGLRMLAQKFAADSVFANTPPANSKLYPAMRAVSKVPILGKLAMAFHRVPYNIAIEFGQRSFVALATAKFREEIFAGGARADIAWTKFLTGNAALIALADLAVKGGLVGTQEGLGGAETAKGKLANKRAMGETALSFKHVNEDGSVTTVGYRGMEPFSTSIGMASSVVEILSSDQYDAEDKDTEAIVVAASAALMNQVTQPSFMQGLSDFMAFSDNPTQYGQTFAQRQASILVPNAVGSVAQAMDPTIREVNSMLDAIKAKIPGLSKTLPANTDRWGTDLTRESGLGPVYDAVSPFAVRTTKPTPIDRELDRLEKGVAKPPKKQFFDGVPVNMKLHPKEFTRFVKLAGNEMTSTVNGEPITAMKGAYESEGGGLRDELSAIVSGKHAFSEVYLDPEQTDGPDGSRAEMIQAIVNAYRKQAKHHLLREFPALRAKIAGRHQEMVASGLDDERNEFLDYDGG